MSAASGLTGPGFSVLKPPLLAARDVTDLVERGALPEAWRATVAPAYMRPLLPAGSEVTVVRRAPQAGDVVCLASNGNLLWRRVVGGRPGHLMVRADLAPHSEVWTGDIIGCVRSDGLRHRAARAMPRFWTTGVWLGALGVAHLKGAQARKLGRQARVGPVAARLITDRELPLLTGFGRRVMGLQLDLGRPSPDAHVVGAFLDDKELVGHYTLHTRGSPALSSGLFVDPRVRGGGIGSMLVRELVSHARRLAVVEVECFIFARNLASARVHRSAGFSLAPPSKEPAINPENQRWLLRLG